MWVLLLFREASRSAGNCTERQLFTVAKRKRPPYHTGPLGDLRVRQDEEEQGEPWARAFIVVSTGIHGRGTKRRFGLADLNAFTGLWG